jgi:type I restriction enzyme, S subunit
MKDVRSLPLPPLPSLATQRKIAAILSAYDDLIENNLRRIKILEEMAQNLYREWFVKFRFPGHQHARFTDSPLGRIPEGWEAVPLGKLANQIRDGVNLDSVDPATPYFGLEHLPRKSISLADWGFASEVQSTKLLFRKGDILFGKIRPYFHKVGVAPLPGVCSSDTIVIRPRAADWFGLVLGCTSSSEFVEHATATSQGTKMPRANWDVLVKYQIPMPPQPILGPFNEFISEVVSQLQNFVFRNRILRRTRDLLLPRLISGEVDVSELDIAVPEEAVT